MTKMSSKTKMCSKTKMTNNRSEGRRSLARLRRHIQAVVLRLSRRRGCPKGRGPYRSEDPSGLRSVVLSLSGAVPQPFATLRSWSRGASRLRCRFAKSLRGASAFAALYSLPSGPLAFTALAEGLRGLRPSQRWVRASGARPQTPVAPTAQAKGVGACTKGRGPEGASTYRCFAPYRSEDPFAFAFGWLGRRMCAERTLG